MNITSQATLVKRAYFGLDTGDLASYDINGSGDVALANATLILRAYFGLDPCL